MLSPIKDFEQLYFISDEGLVWSTYSNKFLTNRLSNSGYYYVDLHKNGKSYRKYIHRLVAETFIPNPNNLPQVNHKDENKLNNNVNNLEWLSIKDNNNYGSHMEKIRKTLQENSPCRKQIAMCDKDTHQIIKIYNSISDASRDTGINLANISSVAKGRRQTAGGYFWKFI